MKHDLKSKCHYRKKGTHEVISEALCASVPVEGDSQYGECQHSLGYQKRAVKVFRKHVSYSAGKRWDRCATRLTQYATLRAITALGSSSHLRHCQGRHSMLFRQPSSDKPQNTRGKHPRPPGSRVQNHPYQGKNNQRYPSPAPALRGEPPLECSVLSPQPHYHSPCLVSAKAYHRYSSARS